MRFVRYNQQVAAVVKNGPELTAESPGSELDDHLGLWFGEIDDEGRPIVYTIPAEYVEQSEAVMPRYQH